MINNEFHGQLWHLPADHVQCLNPHEAKSYHQKHERGHEEGAVLKAVHDAALTPWLVHRVKNMGPATDHDCEGDLPVQRTTATQAASRECGPSQRSQFSTWSGEPDSINTTTADRSNFRTSSSTSHHHALGPYASYKNPKEA